MKPTLRDIYDEFAAVYESNRGLFDMKPVLEPFFAGLSREKGRLLDLGCGAGEPFPRYFLDRGWDVVGVDFSKKMLQLAAQYAPGMHVICDDMAEVDFAPAQFDAVTCIYALFHVPRARHPELFAKFRRWLRPGGQVLFTYATKAYTGADEFEGEKEFMGRRLFYSHVSPEKLRDQLADAGLAGQAFDHRDIGGETFLWVVAAKPLAGEG